MPSVDRDGAKIVKDILQFPKKKRIKNENKDLGWTQLLHFFFKYFIYALYYLYNLK